MPKNRAQGAHLSNSIIHVCLSVTSVNAAVVDSDHPRFKAVPSGSHLQLPLPDIPVAKVLDGRYASGTLSFAVVDWGQTEPVFEVSGGQTEPAFEVSKEAGLCS